MKQLTLRSFSKSGQLIDTTLLGKRVLVLFELGFCRVCKEAAVQLELFSKRHPDVICARLDCASPENKQALVYFERLIRFPSIWLFDVQGQPCSQSAGNDIESLESLIGRDQTCDF